MLSSELRISKLGVGSLIGDNFVNRLPARSEGRVRVSLPLPYVQTLLDKPRRSRHIDIIDRCDSGQ